MAHLFGELAEECAGELNVRCKKRNRTMNDKQGIVYILSNEAMPGLLNRVRNSAYKILDISGKFLSDIYNEIYSAEE